MTQSEYASINQRLRGAYNMLADPEAQQVWMYNLREYSYQDVRDACDHFIRNSPHRTTIAELIAETRRIRSERRSRELSQSLTGPRMRPDVCPHCRNRGLVIHEDKDGYLVGHPCTACSFGRINYPGYFAAKEREKAG